jgi:hypothetical protein
MARLAGSSALHSFDPVKRVVDHPVRKELLMVSKWSKWLAASLARIDARGPTAILGAVGLALAAAACGSAGPPTTAPSRSDATPALPPSGKYVGTLSTSALAAAGVDTVNVGAGGVWHLSISPTKMTLTSPTGDDTVYPVVAIAKNRLTLGGNPLCSVNTAQTKNSVYAVSTSPQGLQFAAVTVACKEDGGTLTAGRWTKP